MEGVVSIHEGTGKARKQPLRLSCASCKQNTQHTIRHSVYMATDYPDGTRYVDDYMIVECRGCQSLSFCEAKSNSEDYESDGFGDMMRSVTYSRYPTVIVTRNAMP